MKSVIKRVEQLAAEFGCTVERIDRGKHFKFYIDTPTGKKILTCSVSASDRRADANNRTLFRNWSRRPT